MGSQPKTVKALTRGLEVLAAINELSPATVARLVEETGYPKATVIRLLQTLCREGYAEEIDGGRGYRVSYRSISLSRALSTKRRYQLAAEQELRALGVKLKWPCEVLVRDGFSMIIETNNRESAPIKMQLFERRRFSLLESASGIAYLSAGEPSDTTSLVEEAVEEMGVTEKLKQPVQTILERVASARRDGYVLRDYEVLSPGMRAVAVPMLSGGAPFGGLSLVHYRMYMHPTLMENEVIPAMKLAAERIGENLESDDKILEV
ncbi:MAG: hypothetical protein BMS9Abin37_0718 [Acidobacteriota bacterium]|nr:MAG: hypothetical protein BMS9Abin37_0718 [Acidobacteriota bacterium]